MKFLVLGAGMQGSACAFDLLQQPDVSMVTLADVSEGAAAPFLPDDARLGRVTLDFADEAAVRNVMDGHDVVLSAAPYYLNGGLARWAMEAGCDYSDLGGNTEILFEQLRMDADAREAGVTLVPDVGLAPGMVNVLCGEGIRRLDHVESARMYVGGLPQRPEPPLNYQIVYSLEGVLDYYTTPGWIVRAGERVQVEALSEIEEVEFGELGTLEAFHTAGGASIQPWKYEGEVDRLEYKTLRYPGHAALVRAIRELGFLSEEPIEVGGHEVVPRDVVIEVLRPALTKPRSPDLVALRVVVRGEKDGRSVVHRWDLLDREDEEHGITAMMRTTGYTLSIVGLLMGRDVIDRTGVLPVDEGIPLQLYVSALEARGVRVRYQQK